MKSFRLLFILLLTGLFISAGVVGKNSFLLKNKHAKWGIISFQFASTDSVQSQILKQWDKDIITRIDYKRKAVMATTDGLMVARHQTRADNVMILFYVALLCLLCDHYRSRTKFGNTPIN